MRHPNYLAVVRRDRSASRSPSGRRSPALPALARLRLAAAATDRGRRPRAGASMSAPMPSLAPLPIPSGLPSAGAVPAWVRGRRRPRRGARPGRPVGGDHRRLPHRRSPACGCRSRRGGARSRWPRCCCSCVTPRGAGRRCRARLARAGRAWRRIRSPRAIGPMVIASRVGVLVIGLMAVHAIGYPEGRDAVPRRRQRGSATCRPATTPAGTCNWPPSATSTCRTVSIASRTWCSSRRSRC